MVERRPDYYTQFHCLGGACPDTCCRDWSVVLDEDALADYAAAPAPLGERIARNLATDGDGDVCFCLDEAGLCALLTPGGLCAIQKDWGEGHLCAHCAAYPRFTEEYGCLTETALAVSCQEAARLLLEAPRFSLVETYDGMDDLPFDGVDPGLLSMLEAAVPRSWPCWTAARRPSGTGCAPCWAGPRPWKPPFLPRTPAGTIPSHLRPSRAFSRPPPSGCWTCSRSWNPCAWTGLTC